MRADAGSPTATDALLKDVKVQYGRLDVVVANAVVDVNGVELFVDGGLTQVA